MLVHRLRDVAVHEAVTAAARRTALRVRHIVYVDESGKLSGCVEDEFDEHATHLVAWRASRAVGSLRIVWSDRCASFELTRYFHLPLAGTEQRSAEVNRFAVLADARHSAAAPVLMQAAARVILARGGSCCYIATTPDLLPMYRRFGFELATPELAVYGTFGAVHLALRLDAAVARRILAAGRRPRIAG